MRMLHINTVHVQRESLWVKQLAEEQYKMICSSAWACKHTYIYILLSLLWDCVGGWGPSRCCWFFWSIVQGTCPGWMGEGHRWSLQPCSLSAGGSCGQQHCSSRTRQWCSWSAHSQWCPCRMWWGWVEGDLLFSAGGESVGAVVPTWRVTWCWWSRWDPPWCVESDSWKQCGLNAPKWLETRHQREDCCSTMRLSCWVFVSTVGWYSVILYIYLLID